MELNAENLHYCNVDKQISLYLVIIDVHCFLNNFCLKIHVLICSLLLLLKYSASNTKEIFIRIQEILNFFAWATSKWNCCRYTIQSANEHNWMISMWVIAFMFSYFQFFFLIFPLERIFRLQNSTVQRIVAMPFSTRRAQLQVLLSAFRFHVLFVHLLYSSMR